MSKKDKSAEKIPPFIITIGKILQAIYKPFAVKYATKLFTTPIRHKLPKREIKYFEEAKKELLTVKSINKKVLVYKIGTGERKILLIHGWSGRATQMVNIAHNFKEQNYTVYSFDAPAHGESGGKTTIMLEFIESMFAIDKQYGPFEFAVGHSLGGMALINALSKGFSAKKGIIIGAADKITDILYHFISRLELKKDIAIKMRDFFEKKYNIPMEDFAPSSTIHLIEKPLLIVHDKHDYDVPIITSETLHKLAKNSTFMITEKLGHRKVLGNKEVIEAINTFVKE